MTARQLRPLRVPRVQLVADAVEELDVALLRVLAQGVDEGPGHGARRLGPDGHVGAKAVSLSVLFHAHFH